MTRKTKETKRNRSVLRFILGIGNPGQKYAFTRHNAGFLILDKFAAKKGLIFKPGPGDYWYAEGELSNSPFLLIKPTTYVNLSGRAALQLHEKYGFELEDFLVVTDDINLEEGNIRIRKSGGDGGHNGLNSLIYSLESEAFPRIRFGIGTGSGSEDLKEFVLEEFEDTSFVKLEESFKICMELIEHFILDGMQGLFDNYSKIVKLRKKGAES